MHAWFYINSGHQWSMILSYDESMLQRKNLVLVQMIDKLHTIPRLSHIHEVVVLIDTRSVIKRMPNNN